MVADSACAGCGLVLPASDGPTHPYVGASAACWGLFAVWSGGVAISLPVAPVRQLALDGYMVQHPGVPERRSTRSVGIHLMSLCLQLERGLPSPEAPALIQRLLRRPPAFRWLDPPDPNGRLTIADIVAAADGAAAGAVATYASDIWAAWAPHHATVRSWVDASLGGGR
jgi:hypothetical protein